MLKNPAQSYFTQRITGMLMIPLALWILFYIIPQIGIMLFKHDPNIDVVIINIFDNLTRVIFIVVFVMCSMYHGMLGMQSIFDDYIHCKIVKKLVNITMLGITMMVVIFWSIFSLEMYFQSTLFNK